MKEFIVEILNRPADWTAVDLDEDGVLSLSGHEGAELVRIRVTGSPAASTAHNKWTEDRDLLLRKRIFKYDTAIEQRVIEVLNSLYREFNVYLTVTDGSAANVLRDQDESRRSQ